MCLQFFSACVYSYFFNVENFFNFWFIIH
jgi:hypothetical protein